MIIGDDVYNKIYNKLKEKTKQDGSIRKKEACSIIGTNIQGIITFMQNEMFLEFVRKGFIIKITTKDIIKKLIKDGYMENHNRQKYRLLK